MSDSDTQNTLLHYFDELLREPEKPQISSFDKSPVSKAACIADPITEHNEKPKSRTPLFPSQNKTSDSFPREPLSRQKITQPNPPDFDTQNELKEEQKKKLQSLLNQRTLHVTPTVSAPVAVDTPAPEILKEKVETKVETIDVAAPVAAIQALADTEITPLDDGKHTYDEFHSELIANVQWAENGRPHWAQERFEALLFNVAGLTLAVPLISLGQIVTLNKELTPIFGQSEWFMGIFPCPAGQLRIVNTALFVMPEKYEQRFTDKIQYAISLDGAPWALAVDNINQPISLDPKEIKWRTERSKRAWLAGTVKSEMCALLDVPRMAQLLTESDRNKKAAK